MTDATDAPELEGHPIRYLVASVLRDGERGEEPALLDEDGAALIRSEIDKVLDSPELVDVVEMILGIAHALEVEQRSPTAAAALLDLVEREPVIESLKELNRKKDAERSEAVAKAAGKFTGFTGSESQKKAPKDSEAAPKGSIKLGSLDFPKKL